MNLLKAWRYEKERENNVWIYAPCGDLLHDTLHNIHHKQFLKNGNNAKTRIFSNSNGNGIGE